ncbi:ABC transporter permease [Geodermatophilus sp. DF01-2]|uniref:ABC transporter permease n=1 Tax=Geodermatophilus sp. DF01-2 TaxID=2559610 RepID=UPI00107379E7|nr:ABC transporter permease [Geodermatophilus sp. DF01_2]TFV56067.1 ABC transporter permease [Geodermatophilus sp. DF01_2]
MEFLEAVTNSAVRLMVPLLLAALGELISERAGVMNIGLEGMMAAGAFAAYVVAVQAWGVPTAILIAILAGTVVALLMAAGSVWIKGNAFLIGFALFVLVPGVTSFLYIQGGWTGGTPALPTLSIPLLSEIPVIGSALFSQNVFYYLAICLTVIVWAMFARTRTGLNIAAVGHSPATVETKGVSPRRVQTCALIACGALAGLGGAALSLGAIGSYVPDIVGGRGLIVIAIVILGRWTVSGAAAGAFLIAVLDALQLRVAEYSDIPLQLLGALPWVVVILMLIVSARMRSNAPRTLAH